MQSFRRDPKHSDATAKYAFRCLQAERNIARPNLDSVSHPMLNKKLDYLLAASATFRVRERAAAGLRGHRFP